MQRAAGTKKVSGGPNFEGICGAFEAETFTRPNGYSSYLAEEIGAALVRWLLTLFAGWVNNLQVLISESAGREGKGKRVSEERRLWRKKKGGEIWGA